MTPPATTKPARPHLRDKDDDEHEEDDDAPAAAALRAVPPHPAGAAPEPSLADAPPPLQDEDDLGPVAFELQDDDAELGPMDEPAAPAAVDEAAVPTGETVEFTPAFEDDADEDDTAERPR
jgi:hypothetical protein